MEHNYKSTLNDDQNNYLEKYWSGTRADFVRKAIDDEREKINKNKTKDMFQRYSQSFIMLGLGAIFVLFSTSTNNLIAFLMIFFLGVFFVVNGLTSIGWGVFKRWKKS